MNCKISNSPNGVFSEFELGIIDVPSILELNPKILMVDQSNINITLSREIRVNESYACLVQ